MMAKRDPPSRPTSLKESPEILIIGVGNEYRGDDGIGLFLARSLKEKNLPDVMIETYYGEGTGLMALWESHRTVFLIDAVYSGATPGKIYRFDAKLQSFPSSFFNPSTHNFNVAETVKLAKALNLLPPHLIIYGVEGHQFKRGNGISPMVIAAVGEVVEQIIEDINAFRKGYCFLEGTASQP